MMRRDASRFVRDQVKRRRERANYILSASCVASITLIFLLWSKTLIHWFLLPLMLCGILTAPDVIRWLRGKLDLFDPKALIACIAFYGCFITPMLHVGWDRFGVNNDLSMSDDWRTWLGLMAILNAAGLVAYQVAHNLMFRRTKPSQFFWEIDRNRFYFSFAIALTCSVAGVSVFSWLMGGIAGMVRSFEENLEAYAGKGWLLVFAWPLAVLTFIFLISIWTDREDRKNRPLIIGLCLICAFGIGHFVMMGWYGTRAGIIWALFWMTGIIHTKFRTLPRTVVAVGFLGIFAFMYFYGFYKEQGRAGFSVMQTPASWLKPEGYQRDVKLLLLDDLARADVNAYILFNEIRYPQDYDYRWGTTYAGALTILIPRNFWPDRPNFKVAAGTEATVGKAASYDSTRMYGLGGEALLNFGPIGVVPLFMIYGALLGWYRRKRASWRDTDSRLFLAPFFTILFVWGFVADSDNVLFMFITEGPLIIFTVKAASRLYRSFPVMTKHIDFGPEGRAA